MINDFRTVHVLVTWLFVGQTAFNSSCYKSESKTSMMNATVQEHVLIYNRDLCGDESHSCFPVSTLSNVHSPYLLLFPPAAAQV